MHYRKGIYVFGIWLIPIVLILIEASIFLTKTNWGSPYIPYFITFWGLRAVLSPLIVWYTLRFWTHHTRVGRLFLTHIAGFLLFSLLFWCGAYLVLHGLLHKSEVFGAIRTGTNVGVFGLIVDNS